jgi:hypothetical protein
MKEHSMVANIKTVRTLSLAALPRQQINMDLYDCKNSTARN